jgi:hypothetical protein
MSEHIVGVEPTVYNGFKYKSKLEAETAETLDKMGIPWEYETKTYTLQEGFYCPWQKRKVMPIDYKPDFFIGPVIIETKGWKTPDFKLKEKMFYKYLKENEPDAIYYIVRNQKELLEVLDRHWDYLGFAVQVTSKGSKKQQPETKLYNSIQQAMEELGLKGKSMTSVLRSLTGRTEYVYGYKWNLKKIIL